MCLFVALRSLACSAEHMDDLSEATIKADMELSDMQTAITKAKLTADKKLREKRAEVHRIVQRYHSAKQLMGEIDTMTSAVSNEVRESIAHADTRHATSRKRSATIAKGKVTSDAK